MMVPFSPTAYLLYDTVEYARRGMFALCAE